MKYKYLFLIVMFILLIGFFMWLNDNPEYYYLDMSKIHETPNGTLYIDTTDILNIVISEPPPSYYIYKEYIRIQPYLFWASLTALATYLYINRKNIKKIIKKINLE